MLCRLSLGFALQFSHMADTFGPPWGRCRDRWTLYRYVLIIRWVPTCIARSTQNVDISMSAECHALQFCYVSLKSQQPDNSLAAWL